MATKANLYFNFIKYWMLIWVIGCISIGRGGHNKKIKFVKRNEKTKR